MEIIRPTLVLDKKKCLSNIEFMANKAEKHKLRFRPHFKTHVSAEIGSWFREYGVTAITVSSVQMAEYFAEQGWDDITIAFPVNPLEIDNINALAQKIKLNLVVETHEILKFLNNKLTSVVDFYVKIDTGHGRTGIEADREGQIENLLEYALLYKENVKFKGFLSHSGHTYKTKARHTIYNIHFDALMKLNRLKTKFSPVFPDLEISIGDTPSCSISDDFRGVDEIRPGNFVFYDLMQQQLSACEYDQIAIRMVCPVVSKNQSRNEVVIHGGAVHFSKDYIMNIDGKKLYGRIVRRDGNKRILLNEMNYLHDLSQEHGILKVSPQEFNKFKIGDLVEILPVHACLTAHAMGYYLTDEGEIIETMPRH
ncbi:alanine racemase [Prolixibacter denitrificans]|uniref:D-serine deaminase-like pyridoxal phosphate-dependent protein n=1 Tax=Prolixibacter denitrificans TaxID=1541063 RepID=A0A2P8C8Z2_9BACT|nr:alanine racemase [Prolixibacter denitrificans]PSK81428.1 D-serine deaminase-like pyridoxal phosphate-dependent protein [Prolixibacter denitrificans]GET21102.1 metal-activated pyridoxal enzyme [Prolixibacter denitrificans]